MHWSIYVIIFLGILLAYACTGQATAGKHGEVLPANQYAEKLSSLKDVQLLDVRTPQEYAGGHIDGAVNMDVLNATVFEEAIEKLDPSKPVMLYCRSGRRSQTAAAKLAALGFQEIYDLKGGYTSWVQSK